MTRPWACASSPPARGFAQRITGTDHATHRPPPSSNADSNTEAAKLRASGAETTSGEQCTRRSGRDTVRVGGDCVNPM